MSVWRCLGSAVVAVAAALVGVQPVQAAEAAPLPPRNDAFYRPPAGFAAKAPGTVLRSRQVAVATFSAVPLPVDAWQLLYRTTDAHGKPQATVTTIMVPRIPAPRAGRPLLSYQLAEDSLDTKCAPSYQLRQGAPRENSSLQLEAAALMAGPLAKGWAVVTSDYQGPDSAFTVGPQAGHAVLDGIRAALRFSPAGLKGADTKIGMWGYSGGALASGWAAELQPGYAPELKLAAVAEGGLPANPQTSINQVNRGPFAGYLFAVTIGQSRANPKLAALLNKVLTPEGKARVARIGKQCDSTIISENAFSDFQKYSKVKDPFELPVAKQALAAMKMGRHHPSGPLYVYHSINDQLPKVADTDALVRGYCRAGLSVTYYRDLLSEHVSLAVTGAPAALTWLDQRLTGHPAANGCRTITA